MSRPNPTVASKWSSVTCVPETKCITVFVNGDEFSSGMRCVICHQQMKYFSAVLNYLTEKLKPKFGAVRTLYHIDSGKKANSLTDLVHNQKYAAAGVEAFRKQDKWFIDSSHTLSNGKRKPKLSTIKQKSSNVSSTSRKKRLKSPLREDEIFWIYVYRNGETKMEPLKCFLTNSDRLFRTKVMQVINAQLYPNTGAAKRICSVTGQIVKPEDLVNGHTYVAVGNFETFRKRNYSAPHDLDKFTNKRADSSRGNFQINKSWSSVDQQRNVVAVGSSTYILEESVDKNTGYLPLKLEDHKNVFHAKEENSLAKGAVEVEDTKETHVELPVEYWDDPQEIPEDLDVPTNSPQGMNSGEPKENYEEKTEYDKIPDIYQVYSASTPRIIGTEI